MYLNQSSIRTTKQLLNDIEENQKFFLGVCLKEETLEIIERKLNFADIREGQMIFPNPFNGIMSERNAIGEFIPQKSKPKETAYRSQSWETKDWGGYTHSGTSYVPYKRYPRLFIEPKEFKYVVISDEEGRQYFILSQEFENNEDNNKNILFGANLTLEIFNEVGTFIMDSNQKVINTSSFEIVNWEIIPKGEQIWESFNNKTIENLSNSEQILIQERFDYIYSFKPDSVRQGIGGYTGYLIFEFKDKNLFIFDSILYGDAMYIFKDDWVNVSKLTKREIVQNNLAEERIIHNEYWKHKLNRHLK
ncbi:hypothetical protein ACHAL6_05885 [Proteiniclasticum sp. C24MP]|uniref:hypothetical protein n=1 Tax=Proteiniclasticum sp. C24MP TaxID=3374101 RepID=UPI0037549826